MSSRLAIIISILSIIVVSLLTMIYIKKSKLRLRLKNLQYKINSILNGQIGLNNLKILGSLNIINSDQNESFPLKLVSSSLNKNVITFSRYGIPYNEFGILSNTAGSNKNISYSSNSNVSVPSVESNLSIDSLKNQINNIISGKTAFNRLYVVDKLTVVGGGRVKIIDNSLYQINGGLSIINKLGNSFLDSNIMFIGNSGIGSYGLTKVYIDSSSNKFVYDRNSSTNINYKNTSWDSRPVLPSCNTPTETKAIVSEVLTDIESLEKQLDLIINGEIPLNNIVVNGTVLVESKLDSPLTLDVQSCDPTSLIGFNNLDARGLNGYGGPFDWVGPYFDSTKMITYSGKNNTGLQLGKL